MSNWFRQLSRRHFGFCLLLLMLALTAAAQEEGRRVLTQVNPVYPENLKRFNVNGVVKLEVIVSTTGSVKSVKPLGGNPVLVDLAIDAVKKWKYAPGPAETTNEVKLTFKP